MAAAKMDDKRNTGSYQPHTILQKKKNGLLTTEHKDKW